MPQRGVRLLIAAVAAAALVALVPSASADPAAWQSMGPTDPGLRDVSCVSSTFCVAVGWGGPDARMPLPVADLYDGAQWRRMVLPSDVTTAYLDSVSCASASYCMAVGFDTHGSPSGGGTPLFLLYDGVTWVHVPGTTLVDPSIQWLFHAGAIDCPAVGVCYAVGAGIAMNGEVQQLMLTCVATGCLPVPGPTWPETADPYPVSISCSSSSDCVAVGRYFDDSNVERPLILGFDGSTWSQEQAASPTTSTGAALDAELLSVSCPASGWCEAVGRSGDPGSESSFALTLQGNTWSVDPTGGLPSGGAGTILANVSCPRTRLCAATTNGSIVEDLDGSWQATGLTFVATDISCPTTRFCLALGQNSDAIVGSGNVFG